jgi:hypothetical protein
MSDKKELIPYTSFPGDEESDAVKQSDSFGLRIGQAIQYEWFRRGGGACRFYDQFAQFHKLRLYARGEQPIQKYKDELAVDGDLSFLNLDWTPVPILPKFIDIVVNGMSDRLFSVKAYAQDAVSAENRNKYQENIEKQMVSKDLLQRVQESFGINMFTTNPDELPASDEEMELHMQLKYKPSIEIAQEIAVTTILEKNRYESEIRPRLDYDLACLGVAMAKQEFLKGDGIRISYVDPANVVYSYTEDPYFRDCFYWGEVKNVPVTELYKIDPDISSEKIKEIRESGQSWYDIHNLGHYYGDDLFSKDSCTLLYFNYKTTKEFVFKKKILDNGGQRVVERDDTFNPPEDILLEGRFERISKRVDVWYEGVMVMGTNIILKWELAKNMVRPRSASQYAVPNYVAVSPRMYKGNIDSLVRRMIPFADLIQITHLKMQQVVARMVPDGVFIDADGLNEVDLGNGAAYNPEDALRLYFQTGSVIGRSYNQEGEFNNARVPIQQLTSSSGGSKLSTLVAQYNHYLDMIRAVTGLNEARDGTDPDPRALVGVQKLAALNSNTATRHILDSSLFVTKSIAESCSIRIADILEHASFREEFANQIGKYNLRILNDIKDLYIYDFGIFIEVSPDEEQRQKLEENIQIALSKGDINLEDAIDIRELKNVKLANQLLKVKRAKKIDRDQQSEMNRQQMNAKIAMEQQKMAAQAAERKISLDMESKIRVKQAESAFDIERMAAEAGLKKQLMEEEFNYQMRLAGVNARSVVDREQVKEKAKDKRIDQQSSNQSKLIEQRQKGLAPTTFESNEDSLDGFGLEEFAPR